MRINTVEINMEAFGADFANMDDAEQAKFFKGLARELICWHSDYKVQLQFAYIASKLQLDEKKELDNALGMLYFKEAPK
jgi:hypothetical protein